MASRSTPFRSRPELGSVPHLQYFHDYVEKQDEGNAVSKMVEYINGCKDAAIVIARLERDMYDGGVISEENTSLQSLEKSLLDLAADPALTEGVFYSVSLKSGSGEIVRRYMESGSYVGFMAQFGERLLNEENGGRREHAWCVYTKEDILSRRPQKLSSRSDKTYKNLLALNKSSVIKQATLLKQALSSESSEMSLMQMCIHVLRKCQNPSKERDRYLYVYPETENFAKSMDQAFTNSILERTGTSTMACSTPEDLIQREKPLTLDQQFAFLSQIPNSHWAPYLHMDMQTMNKTHHPRFEQHFLFQRPVQRSENSEEAPKYLPTSLRLRILYFTFLRPMSNYVRAMCTRWYKKCTEGEQEPNQYINMEENEEPIQRPAKRRRTYASRVVKLTPAMLSEDQSVSTMENVSEERSVFTNFRERLVTDGFIMLRSVSDEGGMFIMNSFSSDSGNIVPFSFEHLTFEHIEGELQINCTCKLYAYLQGVGARNFEAEADVFLDRSYTCMHCRFAFESLQELCRNPTLLEEPGESVLLQKMAENKAALNAPVFIPGYPLPGHPLKMSVKGGEDFACSFVHLSADRKFVNCQKGMCQASMRNKKKSDTLLELTEQDRICPHLQTLHANKEVWQDHLEDAVPNQANEENMEDFQVRGIQSQNGKFNTRTGLWEFDAFSKHEPHKDLDEELQRNVRKRATENDSSCRRDGDGYLIAQPLKPCVPANCLCGAGYQEDDFEVDYSTKVYTRYAPMKVQVLRLHCSNRSTACLITYSGEKDCLHQLSKDTCAGDEIGWDFVDRVISSKLSFAAYVSQSTRTYRSAIQSSAPFMSAVTFVQWFFSWLSAMNLDFRSEVDPWCKHEPKILAGDGTHIGVAVRHLDRGEVGNVEKPEINETQTPVHKRYDRVFLPYNFPNDEATKSIRKHMAWLCNKILSQEREEVRADMQHERNQALLNACHDVRLQTVVTALILRTYPQVVMQKLAKFVLGLCSDAALVAFLPWKELDELEQCFLNIKDAVNMRETLKFIKRVVPEIYSFLSVTESHDCQSDLADFMLFLVDEIRRVHAVDRPQADTEIFENTYNPEKGAAYYFTEHGCQVRKIPTYNVCGNQMFDDDPEADNCTKIYPSVSRGGFSYMFLWFCPIHGHSYGFHLIRGCEGRKDPFSSLYKYLPSPPTDIFYDFACGLSEYALNREPSYWRQARLWHDLFHGFSHKCSFCFKSSRISSLDVVNSEICEQFNSFIQCIKYTGSHLSQSHFCLFMQFFIYLWNQRKTASHRKRVQLAMACMQ